MGDVGTFLGGILVLLLLQVPKLTDAFGLLLITPLGDSCICVIRRLLSGQMIFQAHRLHLYQRLHQAGWSHSHVSTLYITATALLFIVFLTSGLNCVFIFAAVEVLLGLWLDQKVAVPFALASRQ